MVAVALSSRRDHRQHLPASGSEFERGILMVTQPAKSAATPAVDHSQMKLGRGPVKKDPRTLKLGNYLNTAARPPAAADWTNGITSWGMMLNNIHSNCTIAAAAHAVQVWSVHTSQEVTVPDDLILKYYEEWDGYNPNDPNTDGGGVALNVFNAWRKSAFDTHKLLAFADPAHDNFDEIRQAISIFGGVYIGLSLPMTAKTQAVWDVVPNGGDDAKPGSWGGHAVFVPKYDANTFTCITWGRLMPMTLAFWNAYVDEAHALLGHDWLEKNGSPSHLALDQLKQDLAALHS
jgi:hypothetical protein